MSVFFFNDTATTEIYTLSLHDALPIFDGMREAGMRVDLAVDGDEGPVSDVVGAAAYRIVQRSEEHTSELQSRQYLVCRLLLEKKNVSERVCRQRSRKSRVVQNYIQ